MGIREGIFREGWHLRWPYFERPIIYDVRTHPTVIKSLTGSKGINHLLFNHEFFRLANDQHQSQSAL